MAYHTPTHSYPPLTSKCSPHGRISDLSSSGSRTIGDSDATQENVNKNAKGVGIRKTGKQSDKKVPLPRRVSEQPRTLGQDRLCQPDPSGIVFVLLASLQAGKQGPVFSRLLVRACLCGCVHLVRFLRPWKRGFLSREARFFSAVFECKAVRWLPFRLVGVVSGPRGAARSSTNWYERNNHGKHCGLRIESKKRKAH